MNNKVLLLFIILLLIVFSGTLLAGCSAGSSATPTPTTDSTSASLTLLQTRCNMCHSLMRIQNAQKTSDAWKTTVDRMISYGAQLSPQEEQALVDYLAQNYK